MENFFSTVEPEDLKILSLDYDTLEYYLCNCEVLPKNQRQKFRKHFECQTITIDKYLILKFKDENSQCQIYWKQIETWRLFYYCKQERTSPSDLTFTLCDEDLDHGYILAMTFKKEQDFLDFERLLQQLCFIVGPGINELYKQEEGLGSGAQATIDLYSKKHTQRREKYAIKSYKVKTFVKDDKTMMMIKNEIQFLRQLSFCENIITLESVYYTVNSVQLVMKYAKNGSLREYILDNDNIMEDKVRHIMEQLLLAVDLMHKHHIYHRDLKPDNILILDSQEMLVCIADLGLACNANDMHFVQSRCGTPGYVDPDVLNGKNFTCKSDIYSLGGLFYNLLTGRHLFVGKYCETVLENNRLSDTEQIIQDTCNSVSFECVDLLRTMLYKDSEKRPTAEQCLSHVWFQKDKESLQNIIMMNQQSSIYNSFKSNNNSQLKDQRNQYQSFIVGPNYFQQQMHSPKCYPQFSPVASVRSKSPQFKLCYNQLLKEPSTVKNSATSQSIDNFSNQALNAKKQAMKKSTFFQKKKQASNINEEEKMPLEEQKEEGLNQMVDTLLSFQFNSGDFNEELQEDSYFERKLNNRKQMIDFMTQEKALKNKNHRQQFRKITK